MFDKRPYTVLLTMFFNREEIRMFREMMEEKGSRSNALHIKYWFIVTRIAATKIALGSLYFSLGIQKTKEWTIGNETQKKCKNNEKFVVTLFGPSVDELSALVLSFSSGFLFYIACLLLWILLYCYCLRHAYNAAPDFCPKNPLGTFRICESRPIWILNPPFKSSQFQILSS